MAARLTAYAVAFIVGVTLIAGLIVGAQREDDGAVDLIVINGDPSTAIAEDDPAAAYDVATRSPLTAARRRTISRVRPAQKRSRFCDADRSVIGCTAIVLFWTVPAAIGFGAASTSRRRNTGA